ncbi:hypothetical protein ACHAW5_000673 [Stephanodiscus triporus]|uniref:Metacaspase n=1 Tax=Stephanodiscus triporus TaxID=2934178 RepID=A0ABD3N3V1_9STRA
MPPGAPSHPRPLDASTTSPSSSITSPWPTSWFTSSSWRTIRRTYHWRGETIRGGQGRLAASHSRGVRDQVRSVRAEHGKDFWGAVRKVRGVWDLKTSEEFDVTSSTRRPGISHGGAVCSALLKAMYDTESDVNIASPQHIEAKDLFGDDDDETINTGEFTVNPQFPDTLVLNDGTTASTMTWAQLLRKMKPKCRGGIQSGSGCDILVPTEPQRAFSLVPPTSRRSQPEARATHRLQLPQSPNVELKACRDGVRSSRTSSRQTPRRSHGRQEAPEASAHEHHKRVQKSRREEPAGDACSSCSLDTGSRVLDSPIDETAESYDEAMVPSDYEETGLIRDTLFFKTLLAPMRRGVMVTCIIDCCHTGIMFDLPYLFTTKGQG